MVPQLIVIGLAVAGQVADFVALGGGIARAKDGSEGEKAVARFVGRLIARSGFNGLLYAGGFFAGLAELVAGA